jgi:YVTN family beta-propeller protein
MRRSRSVLVVVVFGVTGALVGMVPAGVSAVTARARCRAIALVTNSGSGTVSTIDVKTRTKNPTDITVGESPGGVAVTPDGKTAFVVRGNLGATAFGGAGTPSGDSVSTIDVKTRTKNPTDITVGLGPGGVAVTPCRR